MNIIKTKILLLFLIMLGLASCYEDTGNYEYSAINGVEVEGLEKEYTVYYKITEMDIPIKVKSDNPNLELEYMWGMYPIGAQGYVPKLDTLSNEKDFNYFVDKTLGQYQLMLRVTEKQTNISHYFYSLITVVTEYSEGWYIMKDNGTTTDLDLFKINDGGSMGIYRDLLPADAKLKGKARALSAYNKYGYMNDQNEKMNGKKVFFAQSEDDFNVYLLEDLSRLKAYPQMFNIAPPSIPKQLSFSSTSSTYSFFDETGLYKISTNMSHFGIFGFPMVSPDGDYKLAKYSMKSFSFVVYYDELNCCLLSQPYNGNDLVKFSDRDASGDLLEYLPNQMNATCVYMNPYGMNQYGSPTAGIGVFENRDTKVRSVYKFDIDTFESFANPILSVSEIPTNLDINKSDLLAVNREYDFMYYANGNKLGMYNISGKVEENNIVEYEAGTTITYIQHIFNVVAQKKEVYKLAVATYKDGKYKVYLYETLAGKPTGTPIVMEGDGRVGEVLWVSPNMVMGNSNYR